MEGKNFNETITEVIPRYSEQSYNLKQTNMPIKSEERSFDEKLAEAVRKYPELYDRSSAYFKDKYRRQIAWANIAIDIELEEGGSAAEKAFINLRKRYNKQRNRVKKAIQSGIQIDDKNSHNMGVSYKFEFLQWINPFLKPRRGRSEMMSGDTEMSGSDYSSKEDDYGDDSNDTPYPIASHHLQNNLASYTPTLTRPTMLNSVQTSNKRISSSRDGYLNGKKAMTFHNREKQYNSDFHRPSPMVSDRECRLPKVNDCKNTPDNIAHDDELDLYGKLIASQLRSLSRRSQIQTQKLISNVVFEALAMEIPPQTSSE